MSSQAAPSTTVAPPTTAAPAAQAPVPSGPAFGVRAAMGPVSAPNFHIPLLGAKVLRIAMVWVSAYFAAKTLQDSYIDKVFMKELEPPSLVNMVYTFMMFQAVFGILIIGIISTVLYVTVPDMNSIVAFMSSSVADMFAELVVLGGVLYFIAKTMEKKKFFNYRYEGLRAIRALRSLMFKTSFVTMTTPFYMFLDPKVMAAAMAAAKNQVQK